MAGTISVIIPVYKVEEYLDESVASVLAQTYRDLEIILVDDGSPDRCPFMCDEWASKDSRIKVIHKENGGLSDARNAGIDIATGEYIAFVDSDDWIMPEMYEHMMNALIKENADICACGIMTCRPDRKVCWGCKEYLCGDSETFLGLLYNDTHYPVAAWNKLYKRKCWENLRFPKGKICEDAFTTYRLLDSAERIVQIPEYLYCYRIRPQSIMTASFRKQRMDEEEVWRVNYQYMKEHYPKLIRPSYDFYLQKVNVLIHAMTKEDKKTFRSEYRYLSGIRKNALGYVLFQSGMNFKYRLKYLSDVLKG